MAAADSSEHERAARHVDREGLIFQRMDARGLVGTLVIPPPTTRRDAAVVVLGGSQGGLDEQDAIAFAKAGFIALALAYFGEGTTLPRALVELPLEYVGLAIEWLRSQPELAGRRVGLVGRSKGGELALRVAATYPEHVGAVVGYASSPVVWQGLPADRRGWREEPKSSWTLDGNPVPFLAFAKPRARHLPRFIASMIAGNVALRPMYERALADTEAREKATTPLEQIAGPVLLISGTDDQLWPAPMLCELAMARLASHQHWFPDQHLTYEGAGHLIGAPGHRAIRTGRFAVGGSPAIDAQASEDTWPRVLDFLEAAA